MNFTVSAIVAHSVKAKNAKDIATFTKALQKLAKTDNLIKISYDVTSGETVIAGAGELHLEIVLNDLRRLAKVEIIVGEPIVALRESVRGSNAAAPALAKSSNKLNRVFTSCSPLHSDLVAAIDSDQIPKERGAYLNDHPEFGVDGKALKRLWCLGGEAGANVLTDETHSVDYLNESSSFFVSAFNKFSLAGPLCGEPVQGVHMKVADAKLHSDRVHRGAGELLDACRRSYSGSLLSSEPCLLEPILSATIEVPLSQVAHIYKVLGKKRFVPSFYFFFLYFFLP
jgi:elongation factor 2